PKKPKSPTPSPSPSPSSSPKSIHAKSPPPKPSMHAKSPPPKPSIHAPKKPKSPSPSPSPSPSSSPKSIHAKSPPPKPSMHAKSPPPKPSGAQGDREAEAFQVSNDDTAVAQRRLEDKQPEEKTNTDCLRSTQQCTKSGVVKHLGVAVIQQQNGLVKETNVTLLAKVNCIFLGYHKSIVGNKLWRLNDVTSKVVLYRNTCFNESGKYKKTFISSGVVAAVEKIYVHESLTFNNTVACEAEIWATKVLLDKAKGNVLGMEIVGDQSGNTLRVSQSRFYNGKLVQTLLEGHSILLLEGSLLGDCDVEKNGKWSCTYAVGSQEYQMVCTRLDIASADVGMLDKFDRGLQTNVQVFVDFDYHMEALSTTKAGYITFTEAGKKKIWLKGLLTESRCELKLVAGIATGALVKGGSRSEVLAQVEVAAYRDDEIQALVQKQIDENMVHQKAILDLALQFDNACTTKKILESIREIKTAKLKKQINAKFAWIHEKYNHRSETHIGGSSSQTHEIGDVYLITEELHQLHLDEEALRETLEEQTMDEKAREEKIRQNQADDDEYFMEFRVIRIDSDYESSD
nr:zinc finger, CCHC-type [Tanacetum cinerariifolium]